MRGKPLTYDISILFSFLSSFDFVFSLELCVTTTPSSS